MSKRWLSWVSLLLVLFSCSYLLADGIEVPYGTRAISLGKAFTAVADNVSAMYWNPAGLAQLKGQGGSVDYLNITTKSSFLEKNDIYSGNNTFNEAGKATHIPDLAYYCGSGALTFAFGAYAISGLSSDFTQTPAESSGQVGILSIGPSVGLEVNEQLSVGAGLGMVMGSIGAQGTLNLAGLAGLGKLPAAAAIYGVQDYSLTASGKNWNANFGVLYRVNDNLKIGTSYRLPQRIIAKGTVKFLGQEKNISSFVNIAGKFNAGAAYSWPSVKGLMTSVDISVTQWNKAFLDSDVDIEGVNIADPTYRDQLTEGIFGGRTELNAKNNFSISLGTEYMINSQWTVRAGIMSDSPATLPAEKVTPKQFLVACKGMALGGTYSFGRIGVDFGYARLRGDDINNTEQTAHPVYGSLVNINPYAGTYKRDVNIILLALKVKL